MVISRGFVAERVRRIRLEAGITQNELALLAGLRRETINRVEKGLAASADTLARISAALRVPYESLMEERDFSSRLYAHPRRTPLRDLRRSRGQTLAECAQAAGVSPTTLSRFERGNEHYPSICDVGRLGRAWAIHNEGLARSLGFADAAEITEYWLARR